MYPMIEVQKPSGESVYLPLHAATGNQVAEYLRDQDPETLLKYLLEAVQQAKAFKLERNEALQAVQKAQRQMQATNDWARRQGADDDQVAAV